VSTHGGLRGRTQDIAEIDQLLRSTETRLVTLTGLPGVGKTRLAMHFAQPIETPLLRQVVWVDASDMSDSQPLLSRIAEAAGLERQDEISADSLGAELDSVPRLLVIDDIDGDADTVRGIEAILANSTDTKVLLAARAPLRVRGERVVRITPFTSSRSNTLEGSPAAQIFVDIALSSGSRISLEDETLEIISTICDRLGGLPGAIELAASRTPTLSPATILTLLDEAPSRDTLARGATEGRDIFDAIAWSESMLTPAQQALLRDLTVFEGPVPIDAIEVVTDRRDLIDDLSILVDVHLVDAHHDPSATTFSLPVLVGEHAAQQLLSSDPDRQRAIRSSHLQWCLATATATQPPTTEYGTVDARICLVEDDLTAAMLHALADGNTNDASVLAVALAPVWLNRGARTFERDHLEQASTALKVNAVEPGLEALLRGWSLLVRSERATTSGDNLESSQELKRIVSLARMADRETLLRVLALGVRTARAHDDRAEMVSLCSEGLEISRQLGDERSIAAFEIWGAMLAHQDGNITGAVERGLRALDLARHIEDTALTISAAGFLKTLPADALAPTNRTLPSARELAEASRRRDDRRTMAWLLPAAAVEALQSGDMESSASFAIEAIELGQRAGLWMWCIAPVMNLSWIAAADGEQGEAAYLHGIISAQGELMTSTLPPAIVRRYQKSVDAMQDTMGIEVFNAAASRGALLSFQDATSEAIAYGQTIVDRRATGEQIVEPSTLTEREVEVVAQLVKGDSNKDIARTLAISPKTVMHHTSSIYRKLNVRGRAEAVAWALSST